LGRDIPYLLINPPLTDPTCPYHAISYVVAAAKAAGYSGGTCLDANIDGLNFVAEPERVQRLLDTAARIRADLETAEAPPTRYEQLQYRHALLGLTLTAPDVKGAIAALQSAETFYDYQCYTQAVDTLCRWVSLLPVEQAPGMYSKSFEVAQDGIFDLDDVAVLETEDVAERIASPFHAYLDGPFAEVLAKEPWRLIGISITYASQLPIALAIARRVRKLLPDSIVVAGGTEVSDLAKFCSQRALLAQIFDPFDAVVLGEGESAIVDILDTVAAVDGAVDRAEVVNRLASLTRPGLHVVAQLGEVPGKPLSDVTFEDLASLPSPDYGAWTWSNYWSPENVALYSPTRGCYWNKCTFCDYGLNTTGPTSPSREVPPDNLRRDLNAVSEHASTVYFAVDAMSPRYIRSMLDVLEELPVPLRWSAELRLERNFPQRRLGGRLSRAGCVSISFGYEAGSQRVLDLIDKGVNLAVVPDVLKELSDNNIGVQMMGFVGFPSESEEEALATYAFLRENSDAWTIAGIGDFVLTSGSIIAKRPGDFGIEILPSPNERSISRMVSWRVKGSDGGHLLGGRTRDVERAGKSIRRFAHDRPFVGGIDSSHSILYFAANGRELVPEQERGLYTLGRTWSYYSSLAGVTEFVTPSDLAEQREQLARAGRRWSEAGWDWLAGRSRPSRVGDSRLSVTARGGIVDEVAMDRVRESPRTRSLAAALFPTGA
jgi:anaerobic magnesium-protoporphyrin IX monomethyl ester cyclase